MSFIPATKHDFQIFHSFFATCHHGEAKPEKASGCGPLKRGDDLLQRLNSTRAGAQDDDDDDDDDDDEDLIETARMVLADTDNDIDDGDAVQGTFSNSRS